MRETCARVLAAALMTAAIATVVGMPALFGGSDDPVAPIAAPPSSFVRSVRLVARPAPRPRPAHPIRRVATPIHPAVVTHSLVVIHTKHAGHQRRRLAAVHTAPAPVAPPAPDPVPVEAPQPPPPAEPDTPGRGHAYGHDKHAE